MNHASLRVSPPRSELASWLITLPLLAPAQAPPAEEVEVALLLKSDDHSIAVTRDEFADWLLGWIGAYMAPLIARDLRVAREAEAAGVQVTPADIEARVAQEIGQRVANTFGGKRELWIQELAAAGRTEGGYLAQRRAEVATELAAERLLAVRRAAASSAAEQSGSTTTASAEQPLEVHGFLSQIEREAKLELRPEIAGGPSSPRDQVVMVADGEPVTREQFIDRILPLRGESLIPPFVEQRLVAEAALLAGIQVSEEELVARIREDIDVKVRDLYQGDPGRWQRELARQGKTEESYWREQRVKTRSDLTAEKLFAASHPATEADLRAAWEATYGENGRQIDVRMLLLRVPTPISEETLTREEWERRLREATEDTKKKLGDLRTRIAAGEDFATLARTTSQDPETRDGGGRFPGGFRPERYPPAVAEALASLREGELSGPLELRGSLALFQITSEKLVPFESVRGELTESLRLRRPTMFDRAIFVNQLVSKTTVESLPPLYR